MEETTKNDTQVKDLSISARKVQEEVLTSMRGSLEHLRYATPRVQLAWGHHVDDKRIRHVTAVGNGRNCACVCPACQEVLISRQGKKRAWHFAHHDGKECRNAVSAAVAKFLAQWLSEGNPLDLPAVTYSFGGKVHERPARTGMVFSKATAQEDPETTGWEVLAKAEHKGQTSTLRVVIRTNPRTPLPKAPDCKDADISTMAIDVGAVLSVALEIDPDLCTDEDWMTQQVVSDAPRAWIWTAAADRLRQGEIDKHVTPYVRAYENAKAKSSETPADHTAAELLEVMAYGEFITPPSSLGDGDVDGAFLFNRDPKDWRAEIFLEMILRPIARAFPHAPTYDATVIGWRQNGAACRKLSLAPSAFLRRIEPEIMIELYRALPGIKEPVKLVDRYLDELAAKGVLRRRPQRRKDTWRSDIYDEQLWQVKGGSYSIAPAFIEQVIKVIKTHPSDKDAILKGALPAEVGS